jgi:hypothetical protein
MLPSHTKSASSLSLALVPPLSMSHLVGAKEAPEGKVVTATVDTGVFNNSAAIFVAPPTTGFLQPEAPTHSHNNRLQKTGNPGSDTRNTGQHRIREGGGRHTTIRPTPVGAH